VVFRQISPEETEAITVGLIAGAWEYADLKSPVPEPERKKPLEKAVILTSNTDAQPPRPRERQAIGAGQSLARRLAMNAGKSLHAEYLAQDGGRHSLSVTGMGITVLGRREMESEKMGSFLAVAQRNSSGSPS